MGFEVATAEFAPDPGDCLVLWNRSPRYERIAKKFESRGAAVIIAENGWIGNDGADGKLIAMCRGQHNGAGRWLVTDEDRWSGFKVPVLPWRSDGEFILVLPQRGFGSPGVAMPFDWCHTAMAKLRRATKRPLRVRRHPGRDKVPEIDFKNVWASVTWGSGAAIKSICAGVPVFYDMPNWIGGAAATEGIRDIESPYRGDRMPMLQRLAQAQWRYSEIASGEPFRRLMRCA